MRETSIKIGDQEGFIDRVTVTPLTPRVQRKASDACKAKGSALLVGGQNGVITGDFIAYTLEVANLVVSKYETQEGAGKGEDGVFGFRPLSKAEITERIETYDRIGGAIMKAAQDLQASIEKERFGDLPKS